MRQKPIQIDSLPLLKDPLFIAGFDGWGNALDISRGMVDYLIQKFDAEPFGKLNPDFFYRFDENRPVVDIKNGRLDQTVTEFFKNFAVKFAGFHVFLEKL